MFNTICFSTISAIQKKKIISLYDVVKFLANFIHKYSSLFLAKVDEMNKPPNHSFLCICIELMTNELFQRINDTTSIIKRNKLEIVYSTSHRAQESLYTGSSACTR